MFQAVLLVDIALYLHSYQVMVLEPLQPLSQLLVVPVDLPLMELVLVHDDVSCAYVSSSYFL